MAYQDSGGTPEAHEAENPLNFETVREAWIAKQLKYRESSFTHTFDINVMHATWNVNMAKATIEIWPIFAACADAPDIVSFGVQELDMTAESLLRGETARAAPWIEHTLNQLNYAATAISLRNKAQLLLAANQLEKQDQSILQTPPTEPPPMPPSTSSSSSRTKSVDTTNHPNNASQVQQLLSSHRSSSEPSNSAVSGDPFSAFTSPTTPPPTSPNDSNANQINGNNYTTTSNVAVSIPPASNQSPNLIHFNNTPTPTNNNNNNNGAIANSIIQSNEANPSSSSPAQNSSSPSNTTPITNISNPNPSSTPTNSFEMPNVESAYELLASRQMVGILLMVFALKKHRPHISDIMTEQMTTGILGVMGNKGGVATRFKLHDSNLVIINSHFNAHQTNIARRNQDYRDICTITFNVPEVGPMSIFEHDNIFWIGDLNYRIDLPDELVREKIRQQQWDYLFQADQLNVQMKRNNVFTGFSEAPISFAPTYKYTCGSFEYDTEKARIPAWCDRVLWKALPSNSSIKNLSYRRHELLQSDHRPVSALFQVPIKSVIKEKRQIVLNALMLELDRKENDTIPDASISTTELNFGEVRFGVAVTRSFVLENTGKVLCRWKFIPKLNDTKVHKDWLQVQPNMGMLMPGEKVTVSLTVVIAEGVAPSFNLAGETLEDILILHLLKGKDHFLSIIGKFLPSSFGNRLDQLVRMNQPARLKKVLTEQEKSKWLRIPKELWRLVDWLYKNAMDAEDLFIEAGNSYEMDQIREAIDTGLEIPNVLPHSVAETFLRFIESLEIPIIPFTFYRNVMEVQSASMAKQLVAKLPDVHYNTFLYIISFLREVLTRKDKNKLTIEKLAYVFSAVMIRPPKGVKQTEQAQKQQTACFELFLFADEINLSISVPANAKQSSGTTGRPSSIAIVPTSAAIPINDSVPSSSDSRAGTSSDQNDPKRAYSLPK